MSAFTLTAEVMAVDPHDGSAPRAEVESGPNSSNTNRSVAARGLRQVTRTPQSGVGREAAAMIGAQIVASPAEASASIFRSRCTTAPPLVSTDVAPRLVRIGVVAKIVLSRPESSTDWLSRSA